MQPTSVTRARLILAHSMGCESNADNNEFLSLREGKRARRVWRFVRGEHRPLSIVEEKRINLNMEIA